MAEAAKSQALSDHKRVGKRFIPPLAQMKFTEVTWVDCPLPELLWIGLINSKYELGKSADLVVTLSKAATTIVQPQTKKWFAPMSRYAELTSEQKDLIYQELKNSGKIELLQEALLPLKLFYPNCPLNFIYGPSFSFTGDSVKVLKDFKDSFSKLFDKHAAPATMMQANAIYIAFSSNILFIMKGNSLENFEEIKNYPQTELSKRVASGVRSTVMVLLATDGIKGPTEWTRYFWNRGLEVEGCL